MMQRKLFLMCYIPISLFLIFISQDSAACEIHKAENHAGARRLGDCTGAGGEQALAAG